MNDINYYFNCVRVKRRIDSALQNRLVTLLRPFRRSYKWHTRYLYPFHSGVIKEIQSKMMSINIGLTGEVDY